MALMLVGVFRGGGDGVCGTGAGAVGTETTHRHQC